MAADWQPTTAEAKRRPKPILVGSWALRAGNATRRRSLSDLLSPDPDKASAKRGCEGAARRPGRPAAGTSRRARARAAPPPN